MSKKLVKCAKLVVNTLTRMFHQAHGLELERKTLIKVNKVSSKISMERDYGT